MAAAVATSETSVMLRRPHFPHATPVGTEMRRNQMKIIDGRKPAIASLNAHSTFTWFITVPMMSENPITKNPARMGRMAYFFMFRSFLHFPAARVG